MSNTKTSPFLLAEYFAHTVHIGRPGYQGPLHMQGDDSTTIPFKKQIKSKYNFKNIKIRKLAVINKGLQTFNNNLKFIGNDEIKLDFFRSIIKKHHEVSLNILYLLVFNLSSMTIC
jgi:hypothetical protein